jgi:hypothetical protein
MTQRGEFRSRWPAFAGHLLVRFTALRRDLEHSLDTVKTSRK